MRRLPRDKFLMTGEQLLAQAESLRATGNPYLARQFENLWVLGAYRREGDSAAGDSPPLAPQDPGGP